MDMFSIILVAITIALDDVEKKLSKRRPENPPALDSSSREVDSRVEALCFDRCAFTIDEFFKVARVRDLQAGKI